MSNRNVPLIDMALCVKCRECIKTCPQKAIIVKENDNNPQCAKCVKYCLLMENLPCRPEDICIIYDQCNSCGECINVCRYGAISWVEDCREGGGK
ncbi:MAG: 4Fe-4S binding protein [Chitinispirillaceae bacterium]|nr:4Fe-4S binding protein [Chitinispirillaceae bacterium]